MASSPAAAAAAVVVDAAAETAVTGACSNLGARAPEKARQCEMTGQRCALKNPNYTF